MSKRETKTRSAKPHAEVAAAHRAELAPAEPANDGSELPEGWIRAAIADVTECVPNMRPEDEPDREFDYVDISAICNSTFRITDTKKILGKDAPSRARRP